MSTALSFSENTFDILAGVIGNAVIALLVALEALCGLIWRYRRAILFCTAVGAFVAVCVAVPVLPVGLGITAVVAWVTYPRKRGA